MSTSPTMDYHAMMSAMPMDNRIDMPTLDAVLLRRVVELLTTAQREQMAADLERERAATAPGSLFYPSRVQYCARFSTMLEKAASE